MFRTFFFTSLLGLCAALLIVSTQGFAQELQTPSLKVDIDVGLDKSPTPYLISCEGFALGEDSEAQVQLLPVAVYGLTVQTPPFSNDALLVVEPGSASLTQTPSDTLADWTGQGHRYVELGEDLNEDSLPGAVFYFDIRDVFASQSACLAAKTLQFKLQIDTASGPIILVGTDAVEPQSQPEQPQPVAQAFAPMTLGRAFATGQASGGVRFVTQGSGISSTRVEIYGLSGKLVFDSGFGTGNTVQWKGLDRFGFSVANGVYLYVISVQGAGGQTLRSKVGKLAVLR